jgi:hypothetical protein
MVSSDDTYSISGTSLLITTPSYKLNEIKPDSFVIDGEKFTKQQEMS